MNIDEIFDKAKSAVNFAAQRTNDVVELSKLKMESAKLNNEINAMYEKLGRSVYNMKRDEYQNEQLISNLCEEIDGLLEKMSDLADEIADKRNVSVCAVCGAENLKESIYCSKCGAKLKTEFQGYPFDAETAPAAEENKEACDCGCDCNQETKEEENTTEEKTEE